MFNMFVQLQIYYLQEFKRLSIIYNSKGQKKEQKMAYKPKISNVLYQHYCEFIQFLNDLHLPQTLCFIFIYFPSLTILGDLLMDIDSIVFLSNLSRLSLSSLLLQMLVQFPWLFGVVKMVILLVLLLPVLALLNVISWSLLAMVLDQISIGYFWQKYLKSYICLFFGWYIKTFQRLIFPIMISIGIKLIVGKSNINDTGIGYLILILSVLNSIIYHYYDLQIPSPQISEEQQQSIFINFPNAILQNLLVLTTIVVINTTIGIIPFYCCLGLFVLRCITNYFLRFETDQYYLQNQFALFCSIAITISLCVGYVTKHYIIMIICACVAICILVYNKPQSISKRKEYEQVKDISDEFVLDDIKKMLEEGKISKAFKYAVLLERRKNSHRDQLAIDIIKNKCYEQDKLSGYSTKTADSLQLLNYEQKIVKIIKNTLAIEEKAVQMLNLMKNKEPKQEILVKAVSQLVDMINQNKEQFLKCMEINAMGIQLNFLIQFFFKKLYNDAQFIRESKNRLQEHSYLTDCKTVHKQLFQKNKGLIAIDVLDEIGKIVKVSNNLPNILGYTPHSLIGLSINQLMPFTVRQCHNNILANFIDNFSGDYARKKSSLEFYAYNKAFHLQKIQIKPKFFFNFFHKFQLSGVITKLETQDYLIITDELGNIEGWSAKIGELFSFDEISGNECIAYNLLPLLPASIKYGKDQSYCLRTIFFRLSKMKNPKLMLFDKKKKIPEMEQIKKKQINSYQQLLKGEQIMQGYVLNVEINVTAIKENEKKIKLIKFQDIKKIENFEKLESILALNQQEIAKMKKQMIQQEFNPGIIRQKSMEQSQDTEFSIIKTTPTSQSPADYNFTLQLSKPNLIDDFDLKLSKDLDRLQGIFTNKTLFKNIVGEEEKKDGSNININENLNIQSTFQPKLQRKSSCLWFVVVVCCIFVVLLIVDSVNISSVFQQLEINKQQILRGNKAEMIYCKTVFNPNSTYVREFDNGKLMIFSDWLVESKLNYTTFDNNHIEQNIFYLLNVQVPATLHRILRLSNGSDQYMKELSNNFYTIIQLYETVYTQFKQIWNVEIDQFKQRYSYELIAYSFGIVIYELFLFFIYRRYKQQRKMAEAFFKFEKADLDAKINSVKMIASSIQKKCQQWFIDLYLHEIKQINITKKEQQQHSMNSSALETQDKIKKENSFNNTGILQSDVSKRKAQIQQFDEMQVNLAKRRFYFFLILAIVLLVTQITYIILSGVLRANMFNSFKQEVGAVDDASKLIVYPNLMMANLFYPAPSDILSKYQNTVNIMLGSPNQFMPDLYELLTDPPCKNCSFLSNILNTNYRSFYSYFMQNINNYNLTSNLSQMYYAIDVITNNIQQKLNTITIPSHSSSCILYLISLCIFFVTVFLVLRNLDSQCEKLECFLKFFNVEALLKNKHMSTIMAKNM